MSGWKQKYSKTVNVLDAAKERVSFIFDNFEKIIVSISGGKDSTVSVHLILEEARKRNRRIGIFFLDEEVIYDSTVKQVEHLMSLYPENIEKMWVQIPFALTNAVSHEESQLIVWEEDKRPVWMRKNKKADAIKVATWAEGATIKDKNVGFAFYDVLSAFEKSHSDTAFIVGLRADESMNRYRAMIKNPVDINGKKIFYATKRKYNSFSFYPIYDWHFHDIWKYLYDHKIKYSKMYDWQYKIGLGMREMRCSSLIHEKSFKSITQLPNFEPKTYQKLIKRIKGISFAQEAGKDSKMFRCQKIPKNFKNWIEYRDHLLKTYPKEEHKAIFVKRFSRHLENNFVARQQCRQLILSDYENNLPVENKEDPRQVKIEKYKSLF